MKTVIVDYALISSAVLAGRIAKQFNCFTACRDIDEDYFELTVRGCDDLAALEEVLAAYV